MPQCAKSAISSSKEPEPFMSKKSPKPWKHFFQNTFPGPFMVFWQKYFTGNPLPLEVVCLLYFWCSWNFHKSTLTFLHKIQAKMHFQKHWQVSEPFSLFCGVQGVFQDHFEAMQCPCTYPTDQSQPSITMVTILNAKRWVRKSGKFGENWIFWDRFSSRDCL